MKISLLFSLCLLLINILSAQEQYPLATLTDQKGVVISPYDSTRRLDVGGLEGGSLAEDPVAKRIFRIPYATPKKAKEEEKKQESVPSPEIPKTSKQVVPPPPVDSAVLQGVGKLPTDLLNFIYAFNQNSTVNDADALVPFYADPVENYFGDKNVTKSTIRKDRANYIKRFPQREYILNGPPVLLGQEGNVYEVMMKLRYVVGGNGRVLAGAVSDFFKIRRGNRRFEIISINEAKATAAPSGIQQQDRPSNITLKPANTIPPRESVYSRYQIEEISLFVDAFAACGEVNDSSAMLDFMHHTPTYYYSRKSPTADIS